MSVVRHSALQNTRTKHLKCIDITFNPMQNIYFLIIKQRFFPYLPLETQIYPYPFCKTLFYNLICNEIIIVKCTKYFALYNGQVQRITQCSG